MDVNQLIAEHGAWFYPITFLWTFLEGETFVIFAGAASAWRAMIREPFPFTPH